MVVYSNLSPGGNLEKKMTWISRSIPNGRMLRGNTIGSAIETLTHERKESFSGWGKYLVFVKTDGAFCTVWHTLVKPHFKRWILILILVGIHRQLCSHDELDRCLNKYI